MSMRLARLLAAAAIIVLPVLSASAADSATPSYIEHIDNYDVTMTLRQTGVLVVHETIDYNFGSSSRHGIIRDIPVREVYGTDGKYDRLYRVSVNSVTVDG